jgi:diaminopimelate epimerase
VLGIDGAVASVRIAMRPASLEPSDVPVLRDAPMIDIELRPLDASVHVTAVSMGNPHAVLFDTTGAARFGLGPLLQNHPLFPQKANVGFARMLERADGARPAMELFVYERGAGWTEACGTGACAAAVAAVETGRASRGQPIEVNLPGGPLEIVVGERSDRIRMTGPARHVFSGSLLLAG